MRFLFILSVALLAPSIASAQAIYEPFRTSATGTFPPTGWTEANSSAGEQWEDAALQFGWGTLSSDAAAHDYSTLGLGNCDDTLTSPTFSLVGIPQPQLSFDRELKYAQWMSHHYASLGNGESEIELSTDGGVTWAAAWSEASTSDGYFPATTVDLSGSAANQAAVALRFRYFGDDAHSWAVDEVLVDNITPLGPVLQIYGTCPGSVTLGVTNAAPYGTVIFAYSLSPGSFSLGGGPCAGLAVAMGSPVQLGSVFADSTGSATFTGTAPPGACGVAQIVAVDWNNCDATYVLTL